MTRQREYIGNARFGRGGGAMLAVMLVALLAVPPVAASAADAPAVSTKPSVGNVIEIRPARIDLMVNGAVEASVAYPVGPLALSTLVTLVARPAWISLSGSTVTLRAGLFQAAQSNLVVAAPGVTSMVLVGDSAGVGGTIRGTASTAVFRHVVLTGWDEQAGEPAAGGANRPFVYYMHGSTVAIDSATFSHLGRPGPGGLGVTLGSATTASVVQATFTDSIAGLSLNNAGSVTVSR
jgi:hypothetical protein